METDKQHQGEPVAWLYRDPDGNARDQLTSDRASNEDRGGWLEIPLYTHADPGVVERLRADVETMRRKNNEYWHETETLRAQLAERDALLRDRFGGIRKLAEEACGRPKDSPEYRSLIEAINPTMLLDLTALSASAEPSNPVGPKV